MATRNDEVRILENEKFSYLELELNAGITYKLEQVLRPIAKFDGKIYLLFFTTLFLGVVVIVAEMQLNFDNSPNHEIVKSIVPKASENSRTYLFTNAPDDILVTG